MERGGRRSSLPKRSVDPDEGDDELGSATDASARSLSPSVQASLDGEDDDIACRSHASSDDLSDDASFTDDAEDDEVGTDHSQMPSGKLPPSGVKSRVGKLRQERRGGVEVKREKRKTRRRAGEGLGRIGGDGGGEAVGITEEEILAQIHKLHLELESVREGADLTRDGSVRGGGEGSGNVLRGRNGADGSAGGDRGVGREGGDGAPGLRTPRLIVVSNRLPVSMENSSGDWTFRISSGGLVSALAGLKNKIPFVWVGWTGLEVASGEQEALRQRLLDENNCYPVFLSEQDANDYYNGFCNDVLWPLFHYVPLPILSSSGERKFDFKYWAAYSKANHRFAEAVMQVYQPGDLVWVQDYHLMLLPSLLRKRLRDVIIGFFLHTPFPSSEVYRILPVRNKILQGVLAADLIGFHTYDYARHFLSVCTRILGLEASPKGVNYKNRFAHVGIFPIGIDPNAFISALGTQSVQDGIANLSSKFRGKKVLLGVDRLDYIKGVPHKLMAFETLLARHPEWKGQVVLIQIAVPSRTEVEAYKELITQTNELVGRINGKYSSFEYSPIIFMNQSVNFNHLCALYSLADVAVVTSIRDGMNLVSYEYVMCQQERHGVLVLSEFAGSAQSLSSAIRVNPWNIEELASALHEALSLTDRERELKHWKLYHYVTKHTAAFWGQSFVTELQQIEISRLQQEQNKLPQSLLRVRYDLLPELRTRHRRLFMFEYEGTLCVPGALADLALPSPAIKRYLFRLCSDSRNSVYIMSGRSKAVLDSWFADLEVGLVSEHGCDFRHPRHPSWEPIVGLHDPAWRDSVMPILQYFSERTPGAHVDLKDKIITWNYRDADPIFGTWQAKELQLHLAETCMNLPVEVVAGHKSLDLRPVGVTRVAAVQRIVAELPEPQVDFVFAAGSDKSDEDVFGYLNTFVREEDGSCLTLCCHVGGSSDVTVADRFVPDVDAALRVLKELAPPSSAAAAKKGGLRSAFLGGNSSGNIPSLSGSGGASIGASFPNVGPARIDSNASAADKGPIAKLRQSQRSASFDVIPAARVKEHVDGMALPPPSNVNWDSGAAVRANACASRGSALVSSISYERQAFQTSPLGSAVPIDGRGLPNVSVLDAAFADVGSEGSASGSAVALATGKSPMQPADEK